MAAPVIESFSQAVDLYSSVSSPISVDKPTGTASGDLLLAIVFGASGAQNTYASTGWTKVVEGFQDATTDSGFALFWKAAGGSEPSTYDFSWSGSDNEDVGVLIMRISGADTTSPIDDYTIDVTFEFVSAPTVPSITTTVADCLAIWASLARQGNETYSAVPSGTASVASYQSGNNYEGIAYSVASETIASTGATGTRSFSSSLGQYVALSIAIAPGAGGATITGTGTPTTSATTASGSGTVTPAAATVTGTGTATIAAVNASGTAEREVTGTGAATTAATTVSGAAEREVVGAGAVSTAPTAATGVAEREITATGAVTTAAVTVSGSTAVSELVDGTGAVTTGAATASGAAEREVTGTGAVTVAGIAVAGAAEREVAGTGAATTAAATASGVADRAITGTGAVSVTAVTVAGTAEREITGSGAVTTGTATADGAATVTVPGSITGTGAVTVAAVTVSGAAEKASVASGAIAIAPITVSGAANKAIDGAGAVTIAAIVVSGALEAEDEDARQPGGFIPRPVIYVDEAGNPVGLDSEEAERAVEAVKRAAKRAIKEAPPRQTQEVKASVDRAARMFAQGRVAEIAAEDAQRLLAQLERIDAELAAAIQWQMDEDEAVALLLLMAA